MKFNKLTFQSIKIINFFYMILIFLFILSTCLSHGVLFFISLALLLGTIYIIKKYEAIFNKKKVIKALIFILFIAIFIADIFLVKLNYKEPFGDYAFFYNSASAFANNENLSTDYIALFPYLGGYIFTLGFWFKIFGISIISSITLNIFCQLTSSAFLFLLFKKMFKDNRKSLIYTSFYLLFPLNIFWTSFSSPIILFNSALVCCITLTYYLLQTKKFTYKLIISVLLGIFIGIANMYRPIMMIYIGALLVVFALLFDKINFKKRIVYQLIIFVLIIFSYYGTNTIYSNLTTKKINKEICTTLPGYSFYVGSSLSSSGMWNKEISQELYEKYASYNQNVNKTQKYLLHNAIQSYKSNGIRNLLLFSKKFYVLTGNTSEYSYNEFSNNINQNYTATLYISEILFIILLIGNFYMSINDVINKNINMLAVLLKIFILAFFCCSILLEVSPRYIMPIIFPLFLMPFLKRSEHNNVKEKRNMKENILGFNVSNYNYEELTKNILKDIDGKNQNFIVNINPLIIMNYCKNEKYKDILNKEKYQIADGIGIVIASKLRNRIIKNTVTGIDLMELLCKEAGFKNKTVFLCGAKPGIAETAKKVLIKKYTKLKIVGVCDGYISEEKMIPLINSSNPDILFVALGSPKQEEFIINHRSEIKAKVLMPVGGSFDVISGIIKRAPKIIRFLHLEWFYRMIKEPKRFRQNLSLIKFLFLVIFTNK